MDQKTYFAVDLEPDVTLSLTLDDGANGHKTDDKGLTLLNGNVHFLSNIRTAEEVSGGDNTVTNR